MKYQAYSGKLGHTSVIMEKGFLAVTTIVLFFAYFQSFVESGLNGRTRLNPPTLPIPAPRGEYNQRPTISHAGICAFPALQRDRIRPPFEANKQKITVEKPRAVQKGNHCFYSAISAWQNAKFQSHRYRHLY